MTPLESPGAAPNPASGDKLSRPPISSEASVSTREKTLRAASLLLSEPSEQPTMVNSIAAITDLPHVKAFAKQDTIEDLGNLVFALMAEAKAIAKARGVILADDPWEMNVKAVSQGTTDGDDYAHIPSMLNDTRKKQLTEIDWITGSIVREAKKAGVAAPYHETLYRLVKAHEASWSLKHNDN